MAIQVYNHISVDLVFDSTIPSIDVMQGDTARGLIVTYLTEIDNLDNSDVSAVLKVQRADGMEGWAQGEVLKLGADMAQVVIDPSPDYTALIDVPGVAKAVLEVYSGDTVVSTFKFRIDVKENPFYGTTIGSLTPKQLETVEQTAYSSAQDWMDAHPEASTTVQDGAITANKIANGAVTRDKIGTGSISATKLDTNSVIEAKIASNAVTTAKIKDSAVTNAKIASGVISEDKLAFNPFADLSFLGKKVGGSGESDYGSAIDITGYRALLLVAGVSTGNRILTSTLIPVSWVTTDGPYSYGASANNFQAHYNAGGTMYYGCVIFDSATSVRISAGNSGSFAALYGIK
jgi:hypothetical protein